jgi:flagellar hook-associated protein 3 FlgL
VAGTRITQSMLSRGLMWDLNDVATRLSQTQRKMSSGKELNRPSDDPFAVSRAISLRDELEAVRQFKRNVNEGLAWNEVTETALGRIGDIVQRARELVIQASSDTFEGVSRESVATEIDQLIEAAKDHANATHAGRYVFAGTLTDTAPYTAGATDTYNGNTDPIARVIGPGVSVQVNIIGETIFGNGQAPVPGDDRLLDVLRDIADHLRGNTPADLNQLRNGDLQRLDANFDELLRIRATVGATTTRLEAAEASLGEVEETSIKLLSDVEDADYAEVLLEYSTQQAVYQSALKAGANVLQSSLLDFLR